MGGSFVVAGLICVDAVAVSGAALQAVSPLVMRSAPIMKERGRMEMGALKNCACVISRLYVRHIPPAR